MGVALRSLSLDFLPISRWNLNLFIYRGFQEHCDKIQINTDARSNKVSCYAFQLLVLRFLSGIPYLLTDYLFDVDLNIQIGEIRNCPFAEVCSAELPQFYHRIIHYIEAQLFGPQGVHMPDLVLFCRFVGTSLTAGSNSVSVET